MGTVWGSHRAPFGVGRGDWGGGPLPLSRTGSSLDWLKNTWRPWGGGEGWGWKGVSQMGEPEIKELGRDQGIQALKVKI